MMLQSLLWVLSYNGYDESIKKIYEYICSFDNGTPLIPYPHDENILSENHDAPDRILWSVLVVEYGDYGTSPRYGWIDKPRKPKEEIGKWLFEMKGGDTE